MKSSHFLLRDLIMSYGTAAHHYHSCFQNISTGPFKGPLGDDPNGWYADKETKKEAMENALKACMDELQYYERKLK